MDERPKPRILCVDDEPRVVEALALVLRREYEVHTASSAEQALLKLREVNDLAVVISDMRMPKMDGAALLHEFMVRRPEATRIMLTGQADRDEAIRAVNQGQIFRFLAKPCPPEQLKVAIDAGIVQHRLVVAERSMLQETLLGCIKALMEVLAIANPVAFGRASHIKRRAMELAARLGSKDFWQLEAAALLSQLGYASLPAALMDKLYNGGKLTLEEQTKVNAVPDMANKLLEHIPRLDRFTNPCLAQNPPAVPHPAIGVHLRELQEVAADETGTAPHVRVAERGEDNEMAPHLERLAHEIP